MLDFEFLPNSLVTYLVGTIPVIAYLLKLTIDNWGATDLEKLRMSNFKRFQISFTKHIGIGIFFLIISYLILSSSNEFTEKEGENLLYAIVIFFTIIFIAAMFIFEKILMFIGNFLTFKYDYYIVDEDGNPQYRIIKPSSNNTLLVEADGIEEFLDANENRRYKKVMRGNRNLSKFYSSKWILHLIISLAVLDIGLFLGVLLTISWMQFVSYLMFIFIFIIWLFLLLNYLLYKNLRRSNRN